MPATHYNTTPENQGNLYNAAWHGREEEVERLVSTRAAHPNTETEHGHLALCTAAYNGDTATVVTLARLGADVNLAESAGDRHTPLTDAARSTTIDSVLQVTGGRWHCPCTSSAWASVN